MLKYKLNSNAYTGWIGKAITTNSFIVTVTEFSLVGRDYNPYSLVKYEFGEIRPLEVVKIYIFARGVFYSGIEIGEQLVRFDYLPNLFILGHWKIVLEIGNILVSVKLTVPKFKN